MIEMLDVCGRMALDGQAGVVGAIDIAEWVGQLLQQTSYVISACVSWDPRKSSFGLSGPVALKRMSLTFTHIL